MTQKQDDKPHADRPDATAMAWMMGLMMGMCVLFFAFFALVPIVGWPLSLAIGAVGALAMAWLHQKLMGGHH